MNRPDENVIVISPSLSRHRSQLNFDRAMKIVENDTKTILFLRFDAVSCSIHRMTSFILNKSQYFP